MEKVKYYYIDNKGNKKRYRGKIEEKDGKLFGVLISNKKIEHVANLIEEKEGLKETFSEPFKAYKDKKGNEHKVLKTDKIINNKVEVKHKDTFEIKFIPPTEDKIWFEYYDKKLKKYVEYTGEVFEENEKYYGEREIV